MTNQPKHVLPFKGIDGLQYRYYVNEREPMGRVFAGTQVCVKGEWRHLSGSGHGFETEEDALIWAHASHKASLRQPQLLGQPVRFDEGSYIQPLPGMLAQTLRATEEISNTCLSILRSQLQRLLEAPTLNQKMIAETERMIADTEHRMKEMRKMAKELQEESPEGFRPNYSRAKK